MFDIHKVLQVIFWSNSQEFDYPDYAGIDNDIARQLTPEFVDAVQQRLHLRDELSLHQWCICVIHRMQELGADEVKECGVVNE